MTPESERYPLANGRHALKADKALAAVEASIEAAWVAAREAAEVEAADVEARRRQADAGDTEADVAFARAVVDHPVRHPWRLVDAALDRTGCRDCGSALGSGPRHCPSCDLADGYRFAAQEADRPGVPAGNEHAIRVSAATLRAPRRYPPWVVQGNRLFLPLFLDGQMPTRREQEELLAASRRGLPPERELERARTFAELAAIAARRPSGA